MGGATTPAEGDPPLNRLEIAPTGQPLHLHSASTGTYALLVQQVREAGLMGRRISYYSTRILLDVAFLTATWIALFYIGRSWWQVVVAALMAVFMSQILFIGHDAGHRQIFGSRWANDVVGILAGNALTGGSYAWWVDKHRRHHISPNHRGIDPDIESKAVFFYAGAREQRDRLWRIRRYQASLAVAALPLQAVLMHAKSLHYLIRNDCRYRKSELSLYVTHNVVFFVVILSVLGPTGGAIFVVVNQGVLGVLIALLFAPNHKGMPIVDSSIQFDRLNRVLFTTRNFRVGRALSSVTGGLSYQIEHHLFPGMPRPSLRAASAIVKQLCADNRLPYVETALGESYRMAYRQLHDVGIEYSTKRIADSVQPTGQSERYAKTRDAVHPRNCQNIQENPQSLLE